MTLPAIKEILHSYLKAENERKRVERPPSLIEGLHTNASSAGDCARRIALRAAGIQGEPHDLESLVNFAYGDAVHDIVQSAILSSYGWPNAKIETSGAIECITSRADSEFSTDSNDLVVSEIKSVSDYAWEHATGERIRSNSRFGSKELVAEGPKKEHLLQVGITAKTKGAKFMSIVYVRKTAAQGEPVVKEWRFRVGDYDKEIGAEIARHSKIIALLEKGIIADREMNGEILDPMKAKYPCSRYCNLRAACLELGPGEVEVK